MHGSAGDIHAEPRRLLAAALRSAAASRRCCRMLRHHHRVRVLLRARDGTQTRGAGSVLRRVPPARHRVPVRAPRRRVGAGPQRPGTNQPAPAVGHAVLLHDGETRVRLDRHALPDEHAPLLDADDDWLLHYGRAVGRQRGRCHHGATAEPVSV